MNNKFNNTTREKVITVLPFNVVLHRNRIGKIPQDFHRKTVGMVIRTKSITTIIAGMGTVHVVTPWERKSKIFTKVH